MLMELKQQIYQLIKRQLKLKDVCMTAEETALIKKYYKQTKGAELSNCSSKIIEYFLELVKEYKTNQLK